MTHGYAQTQSQPVAIRDTFAICRAALRWVAIRRDASRSDALCTGLRLRLRMAIRRYVAIRRDMWRCHALCVPYVSSTSLPEDLKSGTEVPYVWRKCESWHPSLMNFDRVFWRRSTRCYARGDDRGEKCSGRRSTLCRATLCPATLCRATLCRATLCQHRSPDSLGTISGASAHPIVPQYTSEGKGVDS